MDKLLKYLLIGGCWSVIIIPLIVIICVIVGVLKFYYDIEHGYNYKGATYKYSIAMKEGNGQDAVYWSNKMTEMRPKDYGFTGYALELQGGYGDALKVYENCLGKYYLQCELNEERIQYKLNRRKEAFIGYCQYADHCLSKYREQLKGEWWNDRNMALGQIRYPITMERQSDFMRLSPFLEYKVFLDFMEDENKKLGEPPEYAEAMELYRAIDTEIDEEHLPRSGASDDLDAMREKILAERRKNGVKW